MLNWRMSRDKYIDVADYCTSISFPDWGAGNSPRVFSSDYALRKGKKHANQYSEDQLIEMLSGADCEGVYEALGAISKKKSKKALPYLKNMAFYDEDLAIRREAILTIRKIGGRSAFDILRSLKGTEHGELVMEMLQIKNLKDIDDY
jgi:HEAT repeat protein